MNNENEQLKNIAISFWTFLVVFIISLIVMATSSDITVSETSFIFGFISLIICMGLFFTGMQQSA